MAKWSRARAMAKVAWGEWRAKGAAARARAALGAAADAAPGLLALGALLGGALWGGAAAWGSSEAKLDKPQAAFHWAPDSRSVLAKVARGEMEPDPGLWGGSALLARANGREDAMDLAASCERLGRCPRLGAEGFSARRLGELAKAGRLPEGATVAECDRAAALRAIGKWWDDERSDPHAAAALGGIGGLVAAALALGAGFWLFELAGGWVGSARSRARAWARSRSEAIELEGSRIEAADEARAIAGAMGGAEAPGEGAKPRGAGRL